MTWAASLPVHEVMLHRRADPAVDNSYQALEQLWYADGLDGGGTIATALREAANDPDERIAELAENALKYLAKHAKQRLQDGY